MNLAIVRSGLARRLALGAAAATILAASHHVPDASAQLAPQRRITESPLAGVTFPTPSSVWTGDAAARQNTLRAAAGTTSRSCGSDEYYVWQVPNDDLAEATRKQTDAAFTKAGWRILEIATTPLGQHIYVATRAGIELLMTWVPSDTFIALMLCQTGGPGNAARPDNTARPAAPPPAAAGPRAAADGPPPAGPGRQPGAAAAGGFAPRWVPLGIAGLFALLGVAFLRRAFSPARAAGPAWPTVAATVTSSDVEVKREVVADGTETLFYEPVVAYRYEVGGESYERRRVIERTARFTHLADARRVANASPAGTTFELEVDPASPTTTRPPRSMPSKGFPAVAAALALAIAVGAGIAAFI